MSALIVLVDDNAFNRKLAGDVLELEGYEVRTFEDAPQVLAFLARGTIPDLILMDISLPGMDGLTLTRHLKSEPRFASTPIVAITAYAMKGDEERALQAGCSGYITKPIDTRRFPEQVAAFLTAQPSDDNRLKVMIIEDDRIDMKLAGDVARLSGHMVLSNTTAEAAIKALRQSTPDVVLLDLNLPGMDGLTFLRQLKADPKVASLPVVAVTAYPDSFQRTQMMSAGCAAYLVKPVDLRQLMNELVAASKRPA